MPLRNIRGVHFRLFTEVERTACVVVALGATPIRQQLLEILVFTWEQKRNDPLSTIMASCDCPHTIGTKRILANSSVGRFDDILVVRSRFGLIV